jgi:cytosine/adenosine deaminase-related metal-dependent hydrolase
MSRLIIEGCSIAAMDGASHESTGTEIRDGHIVVTDGVISAIGEGRPDPRAAADGTTIDGRGCLATPGLINSHHHLYQWLTQGMAQQSVLFDWLTELYPLWARIDAEQVHAAATAGLAALALAGCSTSTDHHYIFPPPANGRGDGDGPDALAAEIDAA